MTLRQQVAKWQSHNLIPGFSHSRTLFLHLVLLSENHLQSRNDLMNTSKLLMSYQWAQEVKRKRQFEESCDLGCALKAMNVRGSSEGLEMFMNGELGPASNGCEELLYPESQGLGKGQR